MFRRCQLMNVQRLCLAERCFQPQGTALSKPPSTLVGGWETAINLRWAVWKAPLLGLASIAFELACELNLKGR